MVDEQSCEEEAIVGEKRPIRLCDVCQKQPFKYKCPRCSIRSCSLPCSKLHKEQQNCSGQRDPNTFGTIKRLADFTASTAVNDQKFLESLKDGAMNVVNTEPICGDTPIVGPQPQRQTIEGCTDEPIGMTSPPQATPEHDSSFTIDNEGSAPKVIENGFDKELESASSHRQQLKSIGHEEVRTSEFTDTENRGVEIRSNDTHLTPKQRYLCTNAHRRRIWLTITKDKEEGASRHEQFSDTLFWTITLIFRREEGEGEEKRVVDYNFTANNIPESIAVATLLRQFLKPKKFGPVVNQCDLDAERMAPFQEAGIEHILVYMPVPMEHKKRFYVIDSTKKILDNLRNRFIIDHPTFIVTLDNQCNDYVTLSEQEAQQLREEQRQRKRETDQTRGPIGNGFGSHRGGFGRGGYHPRGGFGGGSFDRSGFGGRGRGRCGGMGGWKRSFEGGDGRNGGHRNGWQGGGPPWKRGRGSPRGGRNYDKWDPRNMDPLQMSPEALAIAEASHLQHYAARRRDPVMDAWCEAIGQSPEKIAKAEHATSVKETIPLEQESHTPAAGE